MLSSAHLKFASKLQLVMSKVSTAEADPTADDKDLIK